MNNRSPSRKLAAILFAEMNERFAFKEGKIKDAKCIFDRERTTSPCLQLQPKSISQTQIKYKYE